MHHTDTGTAISGSGVGSCLIKQSDNCKQLLTTKLVRQPVGGFVTEADFFLLCAESGRPCTAQERASLRRQLYHIRESQQQMG